MTTTGCQHCGASMKLYRAGARYCSGACRVAAHRSRRQTPALPARMTAAARWIRWELQDRNGKTTKAPLRADTGRYASTTNPNTWTTYATASTSHHGVGIGWVLGNGIGCLDLDHCIDDHGALAAWAQELVDEHQTDALLIEVSQSGHGLHIFRPMERGQGRVERGARRIETYPPDSGRYIAVTGRRWAS